MALFPDLNDSEPHSAFDDEDRVPWPILGAMVMALMVALLFVVQCAREEFLPQPLGTLAPEDAGPDALCCPY